MRNIFFTLLTFSAFFTFGQHSSNEIHFNSASIDSALKNSKMEFGYLTGYLKENEFDLGKFNSKYENLSGLGIKTENIFFSYFDIIYNEKNLIGFKGDIELLNKKILFSENNLNNLQFLNSFPNLSRLNIFVPNKINFAEFSKNKKLQTIRLECHLSNYNHCKEFSDFNHLRNVELAFFDLSLISKLLPKTNLNSLEIVEPFISDVKLFNPKDINYFRDSTIHYPDSVFSIDRASIIEVINQIPKETKTKKLILKRCEIDKKMTEIVLPKLNISNLEYLELDGNYNYFELNQAIAKCKNLKEIHFIRSLPTTTKSKTIIPVINISLYDDKGYIRDTANKIKINKNYFNDVVKNKGTKVLILHIDYNYLTQKCNLIDSAFSTDFLKNDQFEALYIQSYDVKYDCYKLFGDSNIISNKIYFTNKDINTDRLPVSISSLCENSWQGNKKIKAINHNEEKDVFGDYGDYYSEKNVNDIEFIRPYLKIRAEEWLKQYDRRDFYLFGDLDKNRDINNLLVSQLDTLYEIKANGDTLISRIYNESELKKLNSLKGLRSLSLDLDFDGWNAPILDSLENLVSVELISPKNKSLNLNYLKSLDKDQLKKLNSDSLYFIDDRFHILEPTNESSTVSFLKSLQKNTNLHYLYLNAPLNDFSVLNNFPDVKRIQLGEYTFLDTSYNFNINNELDFLGLDLNYTTFKLFDKLTKTKTITLSLNEIRKKFFNRKPEFNYDTSVKEIAKIIFERTKGKKELFLGEIQNVLYNQNQELMDDVFNEVSKMN
jgi:hypothetical protein